MDNALKNSKQISKSLNLLFVLIFLGIIAFMAFRRFDRQLVIQSIEHCYNISKYEHSLIENDAKATYPIKTVFEDCMKAKGL